MSDPRSFFSRLPRMSLYVRNVYLKFIQYTQAYQSDLTYFENNVSTIFRSLLNSDRTNFLFLSYITGLEDHYKGDRS